MARLPAFALVGMLLVLPAAACADDIGTIDRMAGDCTGTVAGRTGPLAEGDGVALNETVATGAGARLEIAFNDGTRVTLGETARLTLDTFVYDPAGESRFHAAILGAFRFISGHLEGNATRQASVTTPVALIGVRGTDFWGGPIDGSLGVVVLDGAIAVTAAGNTATLDQAGEGVQVATGGPPGPVVNWSEAKLQRALASVAFP